MASWTRAHWLYLYLAIVMAVCFLLGNVAHSQSSGLGVPKDLSRGGFQQDPFYQPLQIAPESERFRLMNYFASGQSFYLDRDSFQASPDGTLRYNVVGKNLYATSGKDIPNQRSSNVVDCNNGTFIPQTSRDLLDEKGNVISRDTFQNAPPKTLSPSSPLYATLKSACADHFKNADFSKWRF
ncbi:MAG: hypothetical protein VKJ04_10565 [Vampirovibrionales bacterium]|nr:hypothetical protein [Vampirovibrionales bacterium]